MYNDNVLAFAQLKPGDSIYIYDGDGIKTEIYKTTVTKGVHKKDGQYVIVVDNLKETRKRTIFVDHVLSSNPGGYTLVGYGYNGYVATTLGDLYDKLMTDVNEKISAAEATLTQARNAKMDLTAQVNDLLKSME